MTKALCGQYLSKIIGNRFAGAELVWDEASVWIEPHLVGDVDYFLKNDPKLAFNYLNAVSAVDYIECFEIVYHLTSFEFNHSAVIKARIYDRETPTIPSVVAIWPGADFQEREVWDLMGVAFEGHPNLKRIMLWEGFPGHPHRKDFEDVVKY